MKKHLHLPGEIILQFLQDNEEGIRQILTWFLNIIMEYEAQLQAGATHYERTTSRKAHRNGYRKRTLKTRCGALELLKPQLREFPFQTQVFERYSRVEKALQNAVVESYIQGVSTRRIREIIYPRKWRPHAHTASTRFFLRSHPQKTHWDPVKRFNVKRQRFHIAESSSCEAPKRALVQTGTKLHGCSEHEAETGY